MALSEVESRLPPGFRFYPSDEELVCHYLHKKVANEQIAQGTLVEVDLHAREPWELPEVAKLTASEWYFFSFRDRKYATGSRTNRATKTGYWKATGKDREVRCPATRAVVGMRKTLVFYQGRAPTGVKSAWVMHEFRLETPHSIPREDWVLCTVFEKTKGDVDGQDNNGTSSSTMAGGSSNVMPDYYDATEGGYCDPRTVYSTGFATQQDQVACYANAVPANAVAGHDSYAVLGHYNGFPEEVVLREFGTRADGYGLNNYFDMGFEDHGDMRFPPQGGVDISMGALYRLLRFL